MLPDLMYVLHCLIKIVVIRLVLILLYKKYRELVGHYFSKRPLNVSLCSVPTYP